MKLSLLSVLLLSSIFAQAPIIESEQTYGNARDNYANAMVKDSDGNYILVGSTNVNDGTYNGAYYLYIVKINLLSLINN